MNTFKDLGIETHIERKFTGLKIEPYKILDENIIIHHYKIEPSKFPNKGDCLTMQISYREEKRVVFTSSNGLMRILNQVPEGRFPVRTIIKKMEDRSYEFTSPE